MIANILAVASKPVPPVGRGIMVIVMLLFYAGIFALVITLLIRMVRYFKTAGNEQKLIRMELGKLADEVQQLRQELKGVKDAKKYLYRVALLGRTIPHQITGKYGATKIVLVPASPGTGVIAGSSARAVVEFAGVQDVLTKVYGSRSAKNVVKATLDGLLKLRSKEMVESLRGVKVEAVTKR